MCGECCRGFGGTYVTDDDIKKIAQFIRCDLIKFKAEFCSKSGSKYVLSQHSQTRKCIFFDNEKQCSIHPVKPRMCRNWPFIKTVVNHPENWNVMADSCPGMTKDVPEDILIKIVSSEIIKQQDECE
ncbi:MAG: YkgJ family cysteine cluster protein [Desulfamplus sp.]|nr:YkgJ family cysteine cluster protein [Desulfamplus sp.]